MSWGGNLGKGDKEGRKGRLADWEGKAGRGVGTL